MPLLRAKELQQIIAKAQVTHALCDARLRRRAARRRGATARRCAQVRYFNDAAADGLEAAMARQPRAVRRPSTPPPTTPACIAFTSGTTGEPKGTMHFHRDVMAICDCLPRARAARRSADDVFIGSPPLAFTFGLGGLLLFPMRVGASTVLLEKADADALLDGDRRHSAPRCCSPRRPSYRAMARAGARATTCRRLRKCVSAGEALPAATRALWKEATGIEIIDGIGATEMLHIFISADEAHARPGATGMPVPGYRPASSTTTASRCRAAQVGRLAVQGPDRLPLPRRRAPDATTCSDGWNLTGDAYLMDEDGYFRYQARTDDMIISAGYNIAGARGRGRAAAASGGRRVRA